MSPNRALFVLVTLLVLSTPALAQFDAFLAEAVPVAPGDMSAYGIADLTVTAIPEMAFRTLSNTYGWTWSDGLYTTSAGALIAPVMLPTGVQIAAYELEACDETDTGEATIGLFACAIAPGAGCSPVAPLIGTGVLPAPGCDTFFVGLSPPYPVVVNTESRYFFAFSNTVHTGTVRLRAVRVGTLRQISPAPATATFGDVPVSHPLHQFVEALAASGITAGCGGGNYCPNDPITRGQMAVFLAKALGLHWPL